MAISSIGVGSGLPLDDLLNDLRKSESAVLSAIQTRQSVTQSRISAYGTLKASIEQVQKAGKALENSDLYRALKATVDSENISIRTTATAIEGQYNLAVTQLAAAQTLATEGVSSRTSANGQDGLITFTFGDGSQKMLNLDGHDTSINGLIQAINQEDLGLRATIINDGRANSPYRLLLTSTETGSDAAIRSITVSGNSDPDNALQALIGFGAGNLSSTVQEEAAHNAMLSINGISITSQSNTVENAIEGVTLTLVRTSDSPATVKINRDDTAAEKAVTDFVDAYNSLQKTIRTLTAYDTDERAGSPLTGDALARQVQTQLRSTLNVSLPAQSVTIGSLSQLGISTDPSTGELKLDKETLSGALKNRMGEAQQLLTGSTGLTGRLATATDAFLRTGGYVDSANQGATRQLNDLKSQLTISQQRIDARIEAYRQQFSALDSMIAQMNSVSLYLTQQLSMLSNLNEKK